MNDRSETYYDNLLNDMDKTLDKITSDPSNSFQPNTKDISIDDITSMKIEALVFEKMRDSKPISLNDELIPLLADALIVGTGSSNNNIVEVRMKVIKIFKKITKDYNLVCIPRLDIDEDNHKMVNITDLLFFNMEDI